MYLSPKEVVVDFLRHRLTDPRDRAEDTNTESFDGGGKEFTLTAPEGNVSCIISVEVGDEKNKWKEYYYDYQNDKIVFYEDTESGTDNVEITYKYGEKNWIYPDKAKTKLSRDSFPRISILTVSATGNRLGQYNSNMSESTQYQIDVWTKENQVFEIGDRKYGGDALAEYIAIQAKKAFEDHVDEIHPQLFNVTITNGPRDMTFSKEMECFHYVIELELNSIDSGET